MARTTRRKPRRKAARKLVVVNPDAAGIDIGSEFHFVAVPEERDEEPVRKFECFTADLHALADWLDECEVKTVAMESTGVYWIPLFQILDSRGFDVKLVNARDVKNVPGRKSDVQDCRWLQTLHAYGLLRGSFHPDESIRVLRSYVRHRNSIVQAYVPHVQRMQKALTQMNLQLHKVISDITGVTGLRIIDALLAGERDPVALARLKDGRIKSSVDRIAKALLGDYRTELLFVLRQELAAYRFHQQQLADCEAAITSCLESFHAKADLTQAPSSKTNNKQSLHPQLRAELHRITGVDLTLIDGLNALSVQTIISEVGLDPTKWPTAKAFTNWLGLSPNNKITGGKIKSSTTRPTTNRAAQAFRMAAQSLSHSNSALGAYYRRMRARIGPGKALGAAAHKLARFFYTMLRSRQAYVDPGPDHYAKKHRQQFLKTLSKRAASLGYKLVEDQAVTECVS